MWKKRIVSYFIMVILIINLCAGFVPETVKAESKMSLQQLQNKFPAGKYWNHAGSSTNNPDGYTSTPCTHHGNCSKNDTDYSGWCGCNSFGSSIQCFGFANKLAYDAFGSLYTSWSKTTLSNLKPGDVIRYKNNTHSIFVTGVSGNTITYGDCNNDGKCVIRWGATISKSTVSSTLTAVYSAPTTLSTSTANNPVGNIDSVTDATNAIRVGGWAFDEDDPSQSIEVHVYIGGPAGTSGIVGYAISANLSRPDVNSAYGITGNHGFDATLATDKTGTQPVYIYAINIGTGANTLIGQKTVNITSDTQKPTISDIQVKDVTSTGYTVTCTVNDNKGVTSVKFPSWHESKTGNDAKWFVGTISGNKASCRINVLNLGNKDGKYFTHIYAYDNAGNQVCNETTRVNIDAKKINEYNPINLGDEFSGYIMINNWSKVVSVGNSNTNVTSKSDTGATKQRWTFKRNTDGTYSIISKFNGNYLETAGASGDTKTNVQVGVANGSDAQKWYIYRSDYGQYWLRLKCSEECVLDLANNSQEESANIQIHTFNASDAQCFVIVDEKTISERISVDIGADFYATISSVWNGKVLTVGATKVNVVSRTKAEGSAQYWKFERSEDGYYTITSQSNGNCLEVQDGKDIENQNVQTNASNNTNRQKWYIYEAGGGAYYLRPVCSGNRVVTLSDYTTTEGVNVLIRNLVSTTAQRFYINKCSHTFDKGNIDTQPACEKSGTRIYTCTECGATKKETVSPTGHKFGNWNITESATCTEDGIKSRTCSVCGKTETEIIFKNGHNYTVKAGKPTCATDATNVYTCGSCGDSYTETVKATGHKYKDTVIEPTEVESGYTLHECSECEYSYKSDYTDPTGHNYAVIESIDAKCTADGYKKYNCTDCEDTYTVAIPAIGHSYEEKVVKPTCTEKGYTLYTCSECGENYKDTYTNENGHAYTSKITSEATCTTDGLMTYECSSCDEKKTAIIPATGHDYEASNVVPTCETDGYTLHKCKECGLSYKDTYVDKLEHSYIGNETKQPTCLATGTKEYVCEFCGDSYSEIIAKLEHNYVSEVEREANCISDGLIQYTCLGCGDCYSVTELSLGHKYVETVIQPAENEKGYTLHKCTECGDSYTDNYVETTTSTEETTTPSMENSSEVDSKGNDKNLSAKSNDVKPKVTRIKKLKSMKKSLKVSWKKVKGVKGYQIQYSTSKKFKRSKKITIKRGNKTSKTIKKLKANKNYYVRIRTYKIVNGKKYYSQWSKKKSRKTK